MRIRIVFLALAGMPAIGATQGTPSYVVVDPSQLAQYWNSKDRDDRLELPKSVVHSRTEGCVAVGYSIEAEGKPANLVVLRAGYGEHVDKQIAAEVERRTVQYLADMRYEAAPANPGHKAVYTYSFTSFTPYSSSMAKSIVDQRSDFVKAHCVIPDFPAAVARGDLVRKPASQ
jgi:hypothetical protein